MSTTRPQKERSLRCYAAYAATSQHNRPTGTSFATTRAHLMSPSARPPTRFLDVSRKWTRGSNQMVPETPFTFCQQPVSRQLFENSRRCQPLVINLSARAYITSTDAGDDRLLLLPYTHSSELASHDTTRHSRNTQTQQHS